MNANHKEIDFELGRMARVIAKLEARNKELAKSLERVTKLYEEERDNNQMFKRKS